MALAGTLAACLLAAVPALAQAPPAPTVVRDPPDAAVGGLDITRVQLGRAPDGRLRAALTLAAPWRVRDLPALSGPPGSLCLRLWTRGEPAGVPADHLVCVTADETGHRLRGSVLAQPGTELRRVGGATLARSSTRTVVMRFSQSAIGRPATVRFAAEATKPGCAIPACVDTAPNAPATATLTLRER
ncbi:MAG: hypothetical protein QOD55_2173 [Solirubrobacteraceae bacterium]|jgi:hypothetical protein|nr:hypothetical protein [Solirubrobacteraceae bacterium]